MRAVLGTALAAAIGGGITAAVLLGAGVGGRERTVTVIERPGVGTSLAAASGGITSSSAADVYARGAAGVVFIRASRMVEPDGPFEVADQSGTDATGSGFLIDDAGSILTTAHLVSEATELQATQSPLYFQGGNILIGDDFVLIGADYPANTQALIESRGWRVWGAAYG